MQLYVKILRRSWLPLIAIFSIAGLLTTLLLASTAIGQEGGTSLWFAHAYDPGAIVYTYGDYFEDVEEGNCPDSGPSCYWGSSDEYDHYVYNYLVPVTTTNAITGACTVININSSYVDIRGSASMQVWVDGVNEGYHEMWVSDTSETFDLTIKAPTCDGPEDIGTTKCFLSPADLGDIDWSDNVYPMIKVYASSPPDNYARASIACEFYQYSLYTGEVYSVPQPGPIGDWITDTWDIHEWIDADPVTGGFGISDGITDCITLIPGIDQSIDILWFDPFSLTIDYQEFCIVPHTIETELFSINVIPYISSVLIAIGAVVVLKSIYTQS